MEYVSCIHVGHVYTEGKTMYMYKCYARIYNANTMYTYRSVMAKLFDSCP